MRKTRQTDHQVSYADINFGLISTQNATILDQNSTISNQKVKIYELRNKGSHYDRVRSALSSGNIGAASSNFKVSQSVVVVPEGETKAVTLTYSGPSATLYINCSNSSASAFFDKVSWYHDTKKVFVSGWDQDVTVMTFGNTADSQTFKLIVIVTD